MMSLKVKIAGIQMDPKIGEKEQNIANMVNHVRSAAQEKVQLIVFPECGLTGNCFL